MSATGSDMASGRSVFESVQSIDQVGILETPQTLISQALWVAVRLDPTSVFVHVASDYPDGIFGQWTPTDDWKLIQSLTLLAEGTEQVNVVWGVGFNFTSSTWPLLQSLTVKGLNITGVIPLTAHFWLQLTHEVHIRIENCVLSDSLVQAIYLATLNTTIEFVMSETLVTRNSLGLSMSLEQNSTFTGQLLSTNFTLHHEPAVQPSLKSSSANWLVSECHFVDNEMGCNSPMLENSSSVWLVQNSVFIAQNQSAVDFNVITSTLDLTVRNCSFHNCGTRSIRVPCTNPFSSNITSQIFDAVAVVEDCVFTNTANLPDIANSMILCDVRHATLRNLSFSNTLYTAIHLRTTTPPPMVAEVYDVHFENGTVYANSPGYGRDIYFGSNNVGSSFKLEGYTSTWSNLNLAAGVMVSAPTSSFGGPLTVSLTSAALLSDPTTLRVLGYPSSAQVALTEVKVEIPYTSNSFCEWTQTPLQTSTKYDIQMSGSVCYQPLPLVNTSAPQISLTGNYIVPTSAVTRTSAFTQVTLTGCLRVLGQLHVNLGLPTSPNATYRTLFSSPCLQGRFTQVTYEGVGCEPTIEYTSTEVRLHTADCPALPNLNVDSAAVVVFPQPVYAVYSETEWVLPSNVSAQVECVLLVGNLRVFVVPGQELGKSFVILKSTGGCVSGKFEKVSFSLEYNTNPLLCEYDLDYTSTDVTLTFFDCPYYQQPTSPINPTIPPPSGPALPPVTPSAGCGLVVSTLFLLFLLFTL